jgi:hypothetical protein
MSDCKLIWGLGAAAVVVVLVMFRQDQATVPEPAPEPTTRGRGGEPEARLVLAGTSSCAARSCHGGIEPVEKPAPGQTSLQNEFPNWVMQDKHAAAFRVLSSPLSQQIGDKLGLKPSEDARCLACHTNPLAARLPESPSSFVGQRVREERLFGVGCESCHGGADRWLDAHTRRSPDAKQGWAKSLDRKQVLDFGWRPMNDVETRAQTCAGCHVGAPADEKRGLPLRDVNHDLIAAGHPRLSFELGTFLANMPPHWDVKTTKRVPADEAHTWAVGQLVSAEAALELLANRADPGRHQPWPELAEYDCFACHHGLQEPSWRQKRGYSGRTPGSFPYGTWYLSMPRAMAVQKGAGDPKVSSVLDELAKTMATPYPDQNKVRDMADKAVGPMRQWRMKLAKAHYDPTALRDLLTTLAANESAPPDLSWDVAEQLYLGSAALSESRRDNEFIKRNATLSKKRSFPQDFHSPPAFNPDEFWAALRESLKQLAE